MNQQIPKLNNLCKGLLFIIFTLSTSFVFAQHKFVTEQKPQSRDINIETIQNDQSKMALFIELNHKDHVYRENDLLDITVRADTEGYIYLVHIGASGKKTLLIPNKYMTNNKIQPNASVTFPSPNSGFQFRVTSPFGEEKVYAILSKQ